MKVMSEKKKNRGKRRGWSYGQKFGWIGHYAKKVIKRETFVCKAGSIFQNISNILKLLVNLFYV